jgi:hypothetical protein
MSIRAMNYESASLSDIQETTECRCQKCGAWCARDDEQVSKGMFLWYRGDERRPEEFDVCGPCAGAIGVAAMVRSTIEEEEEG